MFRLLFRFLKPYRLQIALVLLFVFVQAMAELYLPTLMSDIVNTGMTMDFVLRSLREREPASLEVCALLDKAERRLAPVPVKYVGFTIPNEFVVGYGLDYRELYRNLPFICVLKKEVYEANGNGPLLKKPAELASPGRS